MTNSFNDGIRFGSCNARRSLMIWKARVTCPDEYAFQKSGYFVSNIPTKGFDRSNPKKSDNFICWRPNNSITCCISPSWIAFKKCGHFVCSFFCNKRFRDMESNLGLLVVLVAADGGEAAAAGQDGILETEDIGEWYQIHCSVVLSSMWPVDATFGIFHLKFVYVALHLKILYWTSRWRPTALLSWSLYWSKIRLDICILETQCRQWW